MQPLLPREDTLPLSVSFPQPPTASMSQPTPSSPAQASSPRSPGSESPRGGSYEGWGKAALTPPQSGLPEPTRQNQVYHQYHSIALSMSQMDWLSITCNTVLFSTIVSFVFIMKDKSSELIN